MVTWTLAFGLMVLLVEEPVSQMQAQTWSAENDFVAESASPGPEKEAASDSGGSSGEVPQAGSESRADSGQEKEASASETAEPTPAQNGDPGQAEERSASQPTPSAQEGQKATASVELIAIEKNIIDYTNQERVRYGLPPLEVCPKLMESARRHAAWMTIHRTLRHTSDPVAENIALGQRSSWEAVQDWMRSSGHRANILNPRHRWIGAAAYRTPEGSIYWCQQFRP